MVQQGEGGCIVSTSSVHAYRALARRYGLRRSQSGCAAPHREHGCGPGPPQYPLQRRDAGVYGRDPYFWHSGSVCGQRVRQPQSQYTLAARAAPPKTSDGQLPFSARPAAGNITGASLPVDGGLLTTGV